PLALLEGADLGLLLDTDVPFVPQSAKRASAMKWIQIDLDPLKADFPMWGFATDIRVQGDSSIILQQICDAVEGRADDKYRRRVTERIASGESARAAAAQKRLAASANKGVAGALNPTFVLATLSSKISQDDVVLNEAIRNGPVLQEHVRRTKPQSYVGLAGGGLGFSGGMALGLKLARPDRRTVQVIGDGGFHFSSPDSVYAVAQQYQIPIFTVVLDNGGWQAVKSATQRVYPKGIAAETDAFQSRLMSGRQGERRDFSAVAKAFGAYGECVHEPDELASAIDRCLAALDDGKAAVLHIHVTRLWGDADAASYSLRSMCPPLCGERGDCAGRSREISDAGDPYHRRFRRRRRQRRDRAYLCAKTVGRPRPARDRREQAGRRRDRRDRI